MTVVGAALPRPETPVTQPYLFPGAEQVRISNDPRWRFLDFLERSSTFKNLPPSERLVVLTDAHFITRKGKGLVWASRRRVSRIAKVYITTVSKARTAAEREGLARRHESDDGRIKMEYLADGATLFEGVNQAKGVATPPPPGGRASTPTHGEVATPPVAAPPPPSGRATIRKGTHWKKMEETTSSSTRAPDAVAAFLQEMGGVIDDDADAVRFKAMAMREIGVQAEKWIAALSACGHLSLVDVHQIVRQHKHARQQDHPGLVVDGLKSRALLNRDEAIERQRDRDREQQFKASLPPALREKCERVDRGEVIDPTERRVISHEICSEIARQRGAPPPPPPAKDGPSTPEEKRAAFRALGLNPWGNRPSGGAA